MSLEALTWAFKQQMPSSSEKFVLVALADYATESWLCFPSIAALQEKTCMARRVVYRALSKLREAGFIEDTGKRTGSTQQVRVYCLMRAGVGAGEKGCQIGTGDEKETVSPASRNSVLYDTKRVTNRTHVTVRGTSKNRKNTFVPPSVEDCQAFAAEIGLPKSDGEYFFHAKEQTGWKGVASWKGGIQAWRVAGYLPSQKQPKEKQASLGWVDSNKDRQDDLTISKAISDILRNENKNRKDH